MRGWAKHSDLKINAFSKNLSPECYCPYKYFNRTTFSNG